MADWTDLREPIFWDRGKSLLKEETDYRKRKEIVEAMKRHPTFQEEVRSRYEFAMKRKRR
jgi:hypothetical protein